jgi:hypothetical protein
MENSLKIKVDKHKMLSMKESESRAESAAADILSSGSCEEEPNDFESIRISAHQSENYQNKEYDDSPSHNYFTARNDELSNQQYKDNVYSFDSIRLSPCKLVQKQVIHRNAQNSLFSNLPSNFTTLSPVKTLAM